MTVLIKNVRLVSDKEIGEPQDVLIQNGIIEAVGKGLNADGVVFDAQGACASPGWFDIGVQAADPGYEHREDLQSAAAAAAAGGYTAVATFPNTHPTVQSKAEVQYVVSKTAAGLVRFYPIGALSLQCEGKDLAELYDMHAAGAIAFSDGRKPVQDAGLLLRAMQYVKAFNGLVFDQPNHKSIAGGGQAHEGVVSTMLGMKGVPALAETLVVQRDLSLLEYAGGRLHLHLLSAGKSVAMIQAAKKAGLPVTCSVAVANLCFTDEVLLGNTPFGNDPGKAFDSNWKVFPPLREEADRLALLEGLRDGTIDFIASNHTPWDEEAKNLEFPYAEFGMTSLETTFALCRTWLTDALSLPQIIAKIAYGPRQVLGLPVPEIRPGAPAELTVFDPEATWVYEANGVASKSFNSPFIGKTLKGKVLGVVNGARYEFTEAR